MKMLIIYHSTYGHIRTMERGGRSGASEIPGVEVLLRRGPKH